MATVCFKQFRTQLCIEISASGCVYFSFFPLHCCIALYCIAAINVNLKHERAEGKPKHCNNLSWDAFKCTRLFCTRESRGFHRFYQIQSFSNIQKKTQKDNSIQPENVLTNVLIGVVRSSLCTSMQHWRRMPLFWIFNQPNSTVHCSVTLGCKRECNGCNSRNKQTNRTTFI